MLDFYIIDDQAATPKFPDKKNYIGGIDFNNYQDIIKKKYLDLRYDYYSDFRLSFIQIKEIKEKCDKDNYKYKFSKIIAKAFIQKKGIIAFCDKFLLELHSTADPRNGFVFAVAYKHD